jgi:HD domain
LLLGWQPLYGRPYEQQGAVLMAKRTNRYHIAGADPEGALRRPLTWQDIRGDTRRRADELLCTDAEAAALDALRVATGETNGDTERHTVRHYLIAERLADTRGITFDRELLLCASFLHDAGLYGPASTGDVYIKDSVRYARRTLEPRSQASPSSKGQAC